jgi:hypothetical protein
MAQKQIAPTTQIIKTPIKTESMATPCAGAATLVAAQDEKKVQLLLNTHNLRLAGWM